MYRIILLFTFVSTVLLTNANADPATAAAEPAAPQAAVAVEAQPEAAATAPAVDTTEPTAAATPAEPTAEPPAVPNESK